MTSTKGGGIPIHNPEPNMASNRRTNLFTYKTFCLITGGSKGLGRCMAMRFAALLPRDSVMLLLARSTDQLLKSKSLIVESSPGIKVKVIPIDLTNADNEDFDDCLKTTFSEFNMNPGAFEQAVIVHNAASMGDVSKRVEEITDKKMLQDYYSLNLTSMILLNNIFLKHFREDILESRVIINISSICALQPFKTWSTYCSGKLSVFYDILWQWKRGCGRCVFVSLRKANAISF